MASIWKINGADIYVSDFTENREPNLVEINPINSNSSNYHWIFEPDMTFDVNGIVVGSGYKEMIGDGVGGNVTLVTDLIVGGITVVMKDFKAVRQMISCQYIDLLQPTTAPVYEVSVTLRTPA
jgi:hypothetical protein